MKPLSSMSNSELENQLVLKLAYYDDDFIRLAHIIFGNIPRKYVIRLISKMNRIEESDWARN